MKVSYSHESIEKPDTKTVNVSIGRGLQVNVRESPSTSAPVITTVKDGETVERGDISKSSGFVPVRLKDGTTGYMMAEYLKDF